MRYTMLYVASIICLKHNLGYCVFYSFTPLKDHLSYLRHSEGAANDSSGSQLFAKICLSENFGSLW